jgi:hypothetical protein
VEVPLSFQLEEGVGEVKLQIQVDGLEGVLVVLV